MSRPRKSMLGFRQIWDQLSRIVATPAMPNADTFTTPGTQPLAEPLEPRLILSADPAIGVNLDALAPWSTAWTFTDAFQTSMPWVAHAYNTVTKSEPWGSGGELELDDKGWPVRLNQWYNDQGQLIKQHAATLLLRGIPYPSGVYYAQWEGTGSVRFSFDAKVIDRTDAGGLHHATLQVNASDGGILVQIDETDPADPIRNIHVWMPDVNGQSFQGQVWRPGADFSPFHPVFLERLRPFKILRFMDWTETNGSTLRHWSERRQVDDARQVGFDGKGVAYEYIIALSNELDADPWINLPYQADDDFLRNYATLVRDTLEPDRKIYLEWSNEIWNYGPAFHTSRWIDEQRTLPENAGMTWGQFVGARIRNAFSIWSDVFAGQEDRLIRVVAGQAVNSWITNEIAKNMNGEFDAISIAGYIGLDRSGLDASTTAEEVARGTYEFVPKAMERFQAHKVLADQYSQQYGRPIQIVAYEGGQHLDARDAPYQQAFYDAQSHPLMYEAYARLMKAFRDFGGTAFVHYTYTSRHSPFGSWGALLYQDQPIEDAPKYRALIEAASGALYYDPPVASLPGPFHTAEGANAQLASAGSTGHQITYAWDLDNDGLFGESGPDARFGDETLLNPLFRPVGLDGPASLPIALRVTDAFGRTSTATSAVHVADTPPTLSIDGPPAIVSGTTYTLSLASFDPGPDVIQSWLINFGDGTPSRLIPGNPASVAYTYLGAGNFAITAYATDKHGSYIVANPLQVAVTPNPRGPYTVTEGASVQLLAVAPEQDTAGFTYEWDLDRDGIYGETGPAAANGDETGPNPLLYAAGMDGPATYNLNLRVTDPRGLATIAAATVHVLDAPPSLGIYGPTVARVAMPHTLSLVAADPGPDLVQRWVVDWGDGTPFEQFSANATFATHLYTAPGLFYVNAVASDKDGLYHAPYRFPVAVANDPPIATFFSQSPITYGGDSTDLTIFLTDEMGLAAATFDNADLLISGPRKFAQYATLNAQATAPSDATVIYRLAAPGGFWGPEDNGVYQVWLMPGAITDNLGAAVAQTLLTSFTVDFQTAGDTLQSAAQIGYAGPDQVIAAQQVLPVQQKDAYYQVRLTEPATVSLELTGALAYVDAYIVDRFGRPVRSLEEAAALKAAKSKTKAAANKAPAKKAPAVLLKRALAVETKTYKLRAGLYFIRVQDFDNRKTKYALRLKLSP